MPAVHPVGPPTGAKPVQLWRKLATAVTPATDDVDGPIAPPVRVTTPPKGRLSMRRPVRENATPVVSGTGPLHTPPHAKQAPAKAMPANVAPPLKAPFPLVTNIAPVPAVAVPAKAMPANVASTPKAPFPLSAKGSAGAPPRPKLQRVEFDFDEL